MHTDYYKEFLPDLDEFREKTMKFHNGEMTVPEYKGFSGGYGSYAQRGGKKHMLRLRMAGGRITKERLDFIVQSIQKYHIDLVKLTTCQSVQFHNLEAEDLCVLIEQAWAAGMVSRGGGGDFPRNVMASPLSGVEPGEYFDVLPYAEAVGEYLMQFIRAVKFPRKLKVSFSSSPKNETLSGILVLLPMRTALLMCMRRADLEISLRLVQKLRSILHRKKYVIMQKQWWIPLWSMEIMRTADVQGRVFCRKHWEPKGLCRNTVRSLHW